MKKRFLRGTALALVLCTLFLLASCGFSYEKSKLGKYIDLSREDYYGLTVSVPPLESVDEADIDLEIESFRLELRKLELKGELATHSKWGDTVHLFYYFTYDNGAGEFLPLKEYSNMVETAAYACVIGGGVVPASLESALTNRTAIETTYKPITDTSATVGGSDVVYLDLTYTLSDTEISTSGKLYGVRFDLSAPGLAGSAAVSALTGLHPGDVFDCGFNKGAPLVADWNGDGANESLKVTGTVRCISRNEQLKQVEETFPDGYADENLAGKRVRMFYAIDSVDVYTVPEITEELLAEHLPEFVPSGGDLTAEFREYVYQLLTQQAIRERQQAIEEKLWEIFDELDCVKKYPGDAIRSEVRELEKQLDQIYENAAAYYEQEYEYNPFASEEDFGYSYYGLADSDYETVREYFKKEVAPRTVKQKLIVYYIADLEDLKMTEEEYETGLSRQLELYAQADGITTAEALEKYGKTFFREAIQYNKVMTWLVSVTLVQ